MDTGRFYDPDFRRRRLDAKFVRDPGNGLAPRNPAKGQPTATDQTPPVTGNPPPGTAAIAGAEGNDVPGRTADDPSAQTATAAVEPLKKLRLLKKIIPFSERKLRDMAQNGELPAVRIGHRYFYRETEIRCWLAGLSESPKDAV